MRILGSSLAHWCAFAVIVCCPVLGQTEEAIEIDFCALEMPQWAKNANLSGILVVELYAGDGGDLKDLRVLRSITGSKSLVSTEEVEQCISTWRLPNLAAATRVVVVWTWEHGKGWTRLLVQPDYGPAIRIHASGDRPAYKPRSNDAAGGTTDENA